MTFRLTSKGPTTPPPPPPPLPSSSSLSSLSSSPQPLSTTTTANHHHHCKSPPPPPTYTPTHSFIHSGYFYSASSSPLLLRGAPDTVLILCRGFTPKRHRQL